jgi:GT2 family glycosyltransferase
MHNSVPLVSVLMSVYNGQQYLVEAIESIRSQTFTGFEFIILDDASSDDTWNILESYAKKDARITLIHNEENIGLTRSLNKGLSVARGKYIARQDADDVALPQRFEEQVGYLEKHPQVVLVSCNLDVIDDQGRVVGQFLRACDPQFVSWFLLFLNQLGGHSQVVFRREAAVKIGGYSESCRYSQDYELWLRLDQVGEIAILPVVLQRWRQHEKSISGSVRQDQEEYQLHISKQFLTRLTGEEIDLKAVKELRDFWGGRSLDASRLSGLHSLLKQIYLAFVQKQAAKRAQDPELPEELRRVIADQFLYWAQVTGLRQNPVSKIKISIYAFYWRPAEFVKFWLAYPFRIFNHEKTLLPCKNFL